MSTVGSVRNGGAMTREVKFGVLAWPQYTDWRSLLRTAKVVDDLGYDSLWTWDHLYPIVGDVEGPIYEGWLTLAAWAQATQRVHLGLMVGANTFRNPGLVAKMVTTLDHISGGRAVLGVGGAWFEDEHRAFGIDFGTSPGQRLQWLDEAVRIMRGMLRGERPSGERFYRVDSVRNDPPPVQKALPLLIGGGGERRTLRIVARYADAWNVGGSIERVRHKDAVLREHCVAVGREEAEIERTLMGGGWIIRDTLDEARSIAAEHAKQHPGWRGPGATTPELLTRRLLPYCALGFRHIYFDHAAPWDDETLHNLVGEVKPLLETQIRADI